MLAISLSLLLCYVSSITSLATGGGKHIFLLAGQSNMSGRGGVANETTWDGYIPPESSPNSSILRLDAGRHWVEASEPLHRDIDVNKTCGVGPGMAFANRLLRKDPSIGVVGLVPCAIGGTNISEWRRGGWLYHQLVRRAEAAVQGGGIIRGLLWYQGESDTVSRVDAESYGRRLERFFVDLRSDLLSPVLPIIQVALASGTGPYKETVREAQLGLELTNVRCVDANGLQLQSDGLHLSTMAQVTLGQMLADAFLQTVHEPLSSPPVSSNAWKNFPAFIPKIFSR